MHATCWKQFIGRLVEQSRSRRHTPALLADILRELRDFSDAERVLYLRKDYHDDHGGYFVASDTIDGRNFRLPHAERIHGDLKELVKQLFPCEARPAGETVMTALVGDPPAQVFQIRFADLGPRHLLALYPRDGRAFPPPTAEEKELALQALTILAHVHHSLDFGRAKTLRDNRRGVLKQILEAEGENVQEVATALCRAWRHFLGAPMVRFWLYNKPLEEFDLLSEDCEPEDEPLRARMSNRLPLMSFGGDVVERGEVRCSADPLRETHYCGGPPEQALFARYPHLLCVPVILPRGQLGIDGSDGRTYGLLDIHLEDLTTVEQPNHLLKSIGETTAFALHNAHLSERREAVYKLNELAQKLIIEIESDERKIGLARLNYFEGLKEYVNRALNANCLSIFEYDDEKQQLDCIASTGIDGQADLTRVFYRKDDGVTWSLFERNTPYLLSKDIRNTELHPEYQGRFKERRTIEHIDGHDPFLAVTIPGPKGSSIGVIRVLERRCFCQSDRLQNFSIYDADLLVLIAAQVSPILQMLRLATRLNTLLFRIEHQLKQPVQGALSHIEKAMPAKQGGPLPADAEASIRYALGAVKDVVRLIISGEHGLQSAVETTPAVADKDRRSYNLAGFLLARIIDVQGLRRSEGITIHLCDRSSLDDVTFTTTSRVFAQVLGNVLDNAVKYAYPGTQIQVRAQVDGGTDLVVEVSSIGLPIAPHERERIFDDRRRGEWTSKLDSLKQTGTGQGLYLARRQMRSIGGQIVLLPAEPMPEHVRTKPPAGFPPAARTTFRLVLEGAV